MSDTGLPYRALWRRELNAGLYGQNPTVTATWKLDHLWLASVLQHRAENSLQMLEESIDAGHHEDTIRHFLEQYEADVALCHKTFADGEARADAAA